jgi:hypothetical protein
VVALGQPTLHHHGWSAYDELLRVPLVMRIPGERPRRIAAQVSLIDLEPTIAEALGLTARAGARGQSLLPLVRSEEERERPAFVEGQNVRALRAGGWAYLQRDDCRLVTAAGARCVAEELYDLAHDPAEHDELAARRPEELEHMRALFAELSPVLPEAPTARVHLQLAADERPHTLEGTLRGSGALALGKLEGGEARPLDAHTIELSLRAPASVELSLEPSGTTLTLELRRDGRPLEAKQLLVGPFALPLLAKDAAAPPLVITADRLSWLDAQAPPPSGNRGEVLLWRDPSRASAKAVTPASAKSDDEVAGMMQRWGYAQPTTAPATRKR